METYIPLLFYLTIFIKIFLKRVTQFLIYRSCLLENYLKAEIFVLEVEKGAFTFLFILV